MMEPEQPTRVKIERFADGVISCSFAVACVAGALIMLAIAFRIILFGWGGSV